MKTLQNSLLILIVIGVHFFQLFSSTAGQIFFDDFENSGGWIRNPYRTDYATSGLWERDNPEQTVYGVTMQSGTTVSGTHCLVTGSQAGLTPGDNDIDNGKTSIRSPDIILPKNGNITVSFSYYFSHYSNSSEHDYFQVKVVGDTAITIFEERGAADVDEAVWETFSTELNDFLGDTVYLLFEAADMYSPSLVEAAVEDIRIENRDFIIKEKIFIYAYDNDTLAPVELYGQEVREYVALDIVVPSRSSSIPARYRFDDYSFSSENINGKKFVCDSLSGKNIACNNLKTNRLITNGLLTCDSMKTAELWVTEDIYPDYVFKDENYILKPLSEIEAYIQKEKHLEGIPTEEEARTGFSVGKMQVKLLEKIEEMTLHLINIDKRIKKLESQQNNE